MNGRSPPGRAITRSRVADTQATGRPEAWAFRRDPQPADGAVFGLGDSKLPPPADEALDREARAIWRKRAGCITHMLSHRGTTAVPSRDAGRSTSIRRVRAMSLRFSRSNRAPPGKGPSAGSRPTFPSGRCGLRPTRFALQQVIERSRGARPPSSRAGYEQYWPDPGSRVWRTAGLARSASPALGELQVGEVANDVAVGFVKGEAGGVVVEWRGGVEDVAMFRDSVTLRHRGESGGVAARSRKSTVGRGSTWATRARRATLRSG